LIYFDHYLASSEADLISKMPALLDELCGSITAALAASAIARRKELGG
jgi:hypothetical protein